MLERLIPGTTNGAGEEPLSQYFINIFSDFQTRRRASSPGRRGVIPKARAEFQQHIFSSALSS
jgi:hypothetical protein